MALKRANPYSTPMDRTRRNLSLDSTVTKKARVDVENLDPQTMFDTPRLASKQPYSNLDGLVVEVEGNIASGKSTLTLAIKDFINKGKKDRSEVFSETVNNDFLAAFYSDTTRFSFAFQMYMLTTRLYQIDESSRQAKQENKFALLDRGAVGDAVFATLNHELGNMDEKEIAIYRSVCQQRNPNLSDKVDLVLYLDVDPSECYRRVHSERKNEAEESIPLAYLDGVDRTYFHIIIDWMANISSYQGSQSNGLNVGPPPPFCILQWNNFGTVDRALSELEAVVLKKRRSPVVKFVDSCPRNSSFVISTEEELAATYESITERRALPCNVETEEVVINWGLSHERPYRRVVMAFLSQPMDVTFYRS